MSRISQKNFEKIAEGILTILYESYPVALSTSQIAGQIARDNEFTGRVLAFLEGKSLVQKRDKGNRIDWLLTKKAKEHYDTLA